jgi:subtilisin family serine protease
VPFAPALSQSVPLVEADQAAAQGFTGTGQVVAVLDTGVAKGHAMLAGKVASEACYSTTVPGRSVSLCPGGAPSSTGAAQARTAR